MTSNILRIAMLVLGLTLAGCQPKDDAKPTSRLIDNARQSGMPSMVEFGASNCRTCRELRPVLESVASKVQGKAHVLIVDLSQDYSLSQDFQIRMMPTMVFFAADGKETGRHIGALDEQEILRRLGQPGAG